MLATGHLSREHPLEIGDRIEIGGQPRIVRAIQPQLGELELRLVVQLVRDRSQQRQDVRNRRLTNGAPHENLRAAADAVARHHGHAAALAADLEEAASWRDAAHDIVIRCDEALGVHPQRKVEFDRNEATYTLLEEPPLLITHHGDPVEIPADAALTKALQLADELGAAGRRRPR